MKHIQTIEFLYKSYNNKTLLADDIINYYRMFDITLDTSESSKINRLSKSAIISQLNELGQEAEIFNSTISSLSQLVINTQLRYNLLFYRGIQLILPLIYVSFDGQFKHRFKNLLDRAFFDSNYPSLSENSYIVSIERSDIVLCIEVLHTRPISSEVTDKIANEIKLGCLLVDTCSQNEIEKRVDFWDYLNLYPLEINLFEVTQIRLPKLDLWKYYFNYLKEKKGYYPDDEEKLLIELSLSNKWLYHVLFTGFEESEKFYLNEDFQEIRNFYIQLGFNRIRYLGGGHFDYESNPEVVKNLKDYIMEPEYWKYVILKEYDFKYRRFFNLYAHCQETYFRILKQLLAVKKKELYLSNEDILVRIGYINWINDPTIDIRPKYRNPVSYDFFTTLRFIVLHEDNYNPILELLDPLVEITDEIKNYIKMIADVYNFTLIEDRDDQEFYKYKDFVFEFNKKINSNTQNGLV